jgi:predicted DNA binding CopG/RHH family protein
MKHKLTKSEKDILESYERGEWIPVRGRERELAKHKSYADNTLKKNQRVNIRLTQKTLDKIKERAAEEGIPYQTLMSSILHKFVSGKLTEHK